MQYISFYKHIIMVLFIGSLYTAQGDIEFYTDSWALLIGINELKLKEFSARGFTPYETFISAAAWPIRHKSESRWIVHKNSIQLDIPELRKGILHFKEENHTLEGDNKLSQYARCVLIWESNGIHISYC